MLRSAVPVLRPPLGVRDCPVALRDLIEECWDENPALRPAFSRIRVSLAQALGSVDGGRDLVEHLIRQMEKNSANLEQQVGVGAI